MSEITSRRPCRNHPDRLAAYACDHCGDAVCPTCMVDAIAANREYCSIDCAKVAEGGTAERYLSGLDGPYRTGLALWRGSFADLALAVLPAAAVVGIAIWLDPALMSEDEAVAATASPWVTFLVLAALLYGVLVSQVTLSRNHTELIEGSPHRWVLRRLLPWLLTWGIVIVGTVLGYLALVIPGIILGLRLFWADEFALAHRLGPIEAAQESWAVTKGRARDLFSFQFIAGLFAWLAIFGGLAVVVFPLGMLTGIVGIDSDAILMAAIAFTFFMAYAAVHAVQVTKFYGTLAAYRTEGWNAPAEESAP